MAICVWILLPAVMHAMGADVSLQQSDDQRIVSFKLNYPEELGLQNLVNNGHQMKIVFEFRVYKTVTGIKSIFGDTLLEEVSYSYSGMWNMFLSKYEVLTEQMIYYFNSFEDFLNFFTSCQHKIGMDGSGTEKYYIQGRAVIVLRQLKSPFNLLAPLLKDVTKQTRWITAE